MTGLRVFTVIVLAAIGHAPAQASDNLSGHRWDTDYRTAMDKARDSRQMLLVVFAADPPTAVVAEFDHAMSDPHVQKRLNDFRLCRVTPDCEVLVEGQPVRLIEHAAFAELHGHEGLAIIDMTDPDSPFWGLVVSLYPFRPGDVPDEHQLQLLLNLPIGSLTQRTLIFAVQSHPEQPHSANGVVHHVLASETEKHSAHQASIRNQGHHNWDSRFHQINAQLPSDLVVQEVCAESWPGETLLDGARECVNSWRQSSGHWSAVRARHVFFGFDMKRGNNGVWYATGIFARRR